MDISIMTDKLHNKIGWDDYFMNIVQAISIKSPDPRTKHGCVIVNKNNQILATGYNGYARGVDHDWMPKDDKKYLITIHAEENAIINATQSLVGIGCKIYVSGKPCVQCLTKLVSIQPSEIIIGDTKSVNGNINNTNIDNQYLEKVLLNGSNIEIKYYEGKER